MQLKLMEMSDLDHIIEVDNEHFFSDHLINREPMLSTEELKMNEYWNTFSFDRSSQGLWDNEPIYDE